MKRKLLAGFICIILGLVIIGLIYNIVISPKITFDLILNIVAIIIVIIGIICGIYELTQLYKFIVRTLDDNNMWED